MLPQELHRLILSTRSTQLEKPLRLVLRISATLNTDTGRT